MIVMPLTRVCGIYIVVHFLISKSNIKSFAPSSTRSFSASDESLHFSPLLILSRNFIQQMASLFVVAALAGLAAASPAAQAFDLGVIGAAPIPTVTAAPLASLLDTISYSPADATVLGSSVANAVGTAAAKVKRDDGGCWGYGGWGPKPSTSKSISYYPSPTPTKSQSQTSGTATTSSSTSCPTTPEAGTYCGFINPEDPCAPQPDG